jgi:DNA-binding GntR family transcriptional regulator
MPNALRRQGRFACHPKGMPMESIKTAPIPARPGSAPPTLRGHVVKMLSADILAGKYKPGDRLNESQIARELNISRIPVREALSQLQEQGLVMNRERRGMFVTHIGAEEVQQINAVRVILEAEALRLAKARMTPDIAARLESLMTQMNEWNGTLLEAAALDLEFHRVIWRAAGNPYLERAMNALMVPLFAHRALDHVSQEIRRWRLSHHRILLDSVIGRTDENPQDALLTHMNMSYIEPEEQAARARAKS